MKALITDPQTILYLLGLDNTQLTFRLQGRDYRLTDVFGNVVKSILAERHGPRLGIGPERLTVGQASRLPSAGEPKFD